jgi:Kef-type K+ transport system membrane component KefB
MHAARSFSPQPGIGTGPAAITLGAGFLLLTALIAGNLAKSLGLPRLTGYLMLGIMVGPHVLGLVTDRMLVELRVFNGAAIALIALTAGTEMDLRTMRPLMRGIAWITFIGVFGTTVLLTSSIYLLRDFLPFAAELSSLQMLAFAIVLGLTLSAKSPAVVVALRKEMDADGPLTRTVLGAVVVSDLLVIVLFALASATARGLVGGTPTDTMFAGTLAWEIFGSGLAGVLIGILIAVYLRTVQSSGALFVVILGFLVAEVGQRIQLDPLLIALSAGMLIRNKTIYGDRLHAEIDAASLPVYIAFFAVAGATIHLDVLAVVGLPATILLAVRGMGFVIGSRLAGRIAGSPPVVQRYAGFGLLPQAGLALALALLFTRSFPQFGTEASALVFGIVGVNELVAPILYRWALVRSGESGKLLIPADETKPLPGEASLANT